MLERVAGDDEIDERRQLRAEKLAALQCRRSQLLPDGAFQVRPHVLGGDELVGQYPRDLVGRKGLEAVSRRVQAQLMAEGQKPLVGEGELEKGPQVRGGEAVQR